MNLHGDERGYHLPPSVVGAEPSSYKPTVVQAYTFSAVISTQKLSTEVKGSRKSLRSFLVILREMKLQPAVS